MEQKITEVQIMKFQVQTYCVLPNGDRFLTPVATYEIKNKRLSVLRIQTRYAQGQNTNMMKHMYKAPMQIALGNTYAFEIKGKVFNITKV